MALPASKKTRALLAYLVTMPGSHPRSRVCELLWDGPDDPRAAVRWSLSKLRPLVDAPATPRLTTDGDQVGFDCRHVAVDLAAVSRRVGVDATTASLEALKEAADCFRGEFLEDLDLPECYRYHEWWSAKREQLRALRIGILSELVRRTDATPETALAYARARLLVDPFSEPAHVRVIELLGGLGRTREALQQYESCRRMLQGHLGARPSLALERARVALGESDPQSAPARSTTPACVAPAPARPLFGRESQAEQIAALVRAAFAGDCGDVLWITGEPGIGKTRLLEEVGAQICASGGAVLHGRAYEAEMVRPYGAWVDALRSSAIPLDDPMLRTDLAPLLPELAAEPTAADRNRLFDAVVRLLTGAAGARAVGLLLDDVQWFDHTSAGLLHFVARALPRSRVLIACAARSTEVDDNAAVVGVARALRRERRLAHVPLEPLARSALRALVEAVEADADIDRVIADSEGNPLFAIEMARASTGGSGPSADIDHVIADRLARVSDRGRDLIPWAAAFGKNFTPEVLRLVSGHAPAELVGAMDDLERRGVIRPSTSSAGSYDFSHDLIRRAAYRQLSEPRRRIVHLQIARIMSALPDADAALAGEIAHHAWTGGDLELATRAGVSAGERALRMFAYAEADALAWRGLQDVQHLPRDARIRQQVALLKIAVHASVGVPHPRDLHNEISRAILDAQQAGLGSEVSTAFHLLSFLHHVGGNYAAAQDDTLRAAEAARGADPATVARALATTGRCLALLERDIPRAEPLLLEAEALAAGAGVCGLTDIPWGLGLVRAYAGEYEQAIRLLESALTTARQQEDHWAECQCLQRMALAEIERGRPDAARPRIAQLTIVAARIGEGSEAPFAHALDVVTQFILDPHGDDVGVEPAIDMLRTADAKALLARTLTIAAMADLAAGRIDRAEARAREAQTAAEAVGHASETVVALALLARAASARGDRAAAARLFQAAMTCVAGPQAVSAYARAMLETAAATTT